METLGPLILSKKHFFKIKFKFCFQEGETVEELGPGEAPLQGASAPLLPAVQRMSPETTADGRRSPPLTGRLKPQTRAPGRITCSQGAVLHRRGGHLMR